MGSNYRLRTTRNNESLETAGNYQAPWTDDDLAFLRENFETMSRIELAQKLGRTVEGCRQRFYTKAEVAATVRVPGVKQTPGQRAWARGVTSFGEDYW